MGRLFDGSQLSEFLEGRRREAIKDVDSLMGEYLLTTNLEDLCNYYVERYRLTTPELKLDQIELEQREVDVDVSGDFNRGIYDRSTPFYIKGTAITFVVPFV